MKAAPIVSLENLPAALSVPMAGRVLGIGRDLAYQLVREGRIPSVRLGRRLIVPRAAVLRMLAEAGEERRETG